MSQLLYYPRQSCSLSDIASEVCHDANAASQYTQELLAANHNIAQANNKQLAGRPLILPNASSTSGHIPICSAQEHKTLSTLSRSIGGVGTMALAELYDFITPPNLYGNLTTFTSGAGAAVTANAQYILKTIAEYDNANKIHQAYENHRAAPATIARAKPKVDKAFKKMSRLLDRKGQQLLHKHAFKTRQVKNMTGRIVTESIPISSLPEVKSLARLAKAGRVLGPGLVVLDGGLRAHNTYNMYKSNDPGWKREAVVQSAGFLMGVGTAGAIGMAVMMLVPGGFLLAIAAGGLMALGTDAGTKKLAGLVYDHVIK